MRVRARIELERVLASKCAAAAPGIMPFGKYRELPLEIVAQDDDYIAWLVYMAEQGWPVPPEMLKALCDLHGQWLRSRPPPDPTPYPGLPFGKHRGESVDDAFRVAPQYVFWLGNQPLVDPKYPRIAAAIARLGREGLPSISSRRGPVADQANIIDFADYRSIRQL